MHSASAQPHGKRTAANGISKLTLPDSTDEFWHATLSCGLFAAERPWGSPLQLSVAIAGEGGNPQGSADLVDRERVIGLQLLDCEGLGFDAATVQEVPSGVPEPVVIRHTPRLCPSTL